VPFDECNPKRAGLSPVALITGVVALLAAVGGCERPQPPESGLVPSLPAAHQEGPVRDIAASPKTSDNRVGEFRKAVAQYLAEARGAAKLLAANPTLFEAGKKDRLIKSLHGRLPAVPPEIDTSGRVARAMEEIMRAVGRGPMWIEHGEDLHYREETRSAKKIGTEKLPQLAEKVGKLADEVESLVGQ
jgi:hypothetical protein